MNPQELRKKIAAAIPKGSIGRYDLLPIFADADLFFQLADFFAAHYAGRIDFVAAPEAIGWVLGTAVARQLSAGFIPVRKGGRLPYPDDQCISRTYIDYSGAEKSLQIKRGSLAAGSRVLIVDEWIETGATVDCCIRLIEQQGCTVAGLATIGIDRNEKTGPWIDSGFVCFVGEDL